eukprot:103694_1
MAAQTSNVNPKIKSGYLDILTTMAHYGQSDIIDRYVEEATNYETKTLWAEIQGSDDGLNIIRSKFIQTLDGILNDGAVPFDVAFCRLIVILPYAQQYAQYASEFIGVFLYFVLGSCFPSLRQNIKLNDETPNYQRCKVLRHLMETYFPNLNDIRCIKFKYSGNKATHVILSILEQHITSTTEYGDPSIASIICDYIQHPHHEFVHFLNNFLWHFPLHYHWRRCTRQFIDFVHHCDRAGFHQKPGETTKGHLLSRLLIDINMQWINDRSDREGLRFEAHRMALMKLNTAEDLSWYFKQKSNAFIQCYTNPKLFIELLESAVCNPWQVLREAIVNHSFVIFFNGDGEAKRANMFGYKTLLANAQYIFENLVVMHFDGNDQILALKVLQQLYFFWEFPVHDKLQKARTESIHWFTEYISRHDYFKAVRALDGWLVTQQPNALPQPSKKRRTQ